MRPLYQASGAVLLALATCVHADTGESTRLSGPNHHAFNGAKKYAYRVKADYILQELDLRPGDTVVDVGAGDGWWTERMAQRVGERGAVFAAEISEKSVAALRKQYAQLPQIKPYVCAPDSTKLPKHSCDLAFFSQTYHHLPADGQVDYLKHLRTVVKPEGRICIIERYSHIGIRNVAHGTNLSQLAREAEAAGWILVRCELLTGTNHYLAILVQESVFPAKQTKQPVSTSAGPAAPAVKDETPTSAPEERTAVEAEIVIRGGNVFDGQGDSVIKADVALKGERIVAVGKFQVAGQPRIIDATGLVVAPGFIDLHTHSDFTVTNRDSRGSVNYLTQGVTTVVTGNCGLGRVDIDAYYQEIERHRAGTNVLHLIPQGTLRQKVMGVASRAPSAAELERMRGLVDDGMREGAWGLSTGLSYLPGSFSSTKELVVLARATGAQRGIYVSHIRNQGTRLIDAITEALEIGRQAEVPVHISHLKAAGEKAQGTAAEAIRLIEDARQQGQAVTADQYPYHASSTSLVAMVIPPSLRARGDFAERLNDPDELPKIRAVIEQQILARDGPERLVVASFAHRRGWQGKTLAELEKQEKQAAADLAIFMLRHGGAKMINFSMSEADVRQIMQAPFVATASDGRARDLGTQDLFHPRDFGTFPRKIGWYALEKKVLPLPQALRSATGLPADILQLPQRGYLREGYFADVVVFDPRSFRDTPSYDEPRRTARGVVYLFVNGQLAVDQEKPTGTLAGRALRHVSR